MKSIAATIGLSLVASVAFAQSPYVGLQTRPIKALSEQQVGTSRRGAAWAWR